MGRRLPVALVAVALGGCFDPELPGLSCELGLCPVGFRCDEATRQCVPVGPSGPFSVPEPVVELDGLKDPSATDDLLELVASRDDTAGNDDIYVSTRASTSEPWSEPVEADGPISNGDVSNPEISRDGLSVAIGFDDGSIESIYVARRGRRGEPFDSLDVVSELEGGDRTTHLSTSADGRIGVFASDRDSNGNSRDLYEVRRETPGQPWGPPRRLDELSDGGSQRGPNLSPDGLTLYYDVDDDDGRRIYRASRAGIDEPFEPAEVAELNGGDRDYDAWVSGDGRVVLFVSDRDGDERIYTAAR